MQKQLSNEKSYRNLFLIAALYDFVLGSAFFIFMGFIFDNILNISSPTYPVFFQAAAAFVFVMGIGFYFVYLNMYRNIDIVKVGIAFSFFFSVMIRRLSISTLCPGKTPFRSVDLQAT